MNVYSRDIMICATVYVKASSAEAAEKAIRGIEGKMFAAGRTNFESEVPVFGDRFDSPDMPKVSLSPAMTIQGHWPKSKTERVE